MKEAFDTMAEHWGVTLWLGIVAIAMTVGSASAIGEIIAHRKKKE